MKPPEDIKKGLEGCGGLDGDCEKCPYDEQTIYCNDRLMRDALAYIQQLEERNKTIEYTLLGVMHSIDKWLDAEPYDFDKDDGTEAATRASNAREVALKAIDKLESRLAQVERERDAMKHDLLRGPCEACKHGETYLNDCRTLDTCIWEWRGVCAENTEEEN